MTGDAARRPGVRASAGRGGPRPACPPQDLAAGGCLRFEAGTGRHRLWGTAQLSHDGLSVNLLGGEVPHIGAVAVSIPRVSLSSPRRRSATTSVFTIVGHKEDELARSVASELARRLGVITVVVAGVHIRRAGPADIATVLGNANQAVKAILAEVKARGGPVRGFPVGMRVGGKGGRHAT